MSKLDFRLHALFIGALLGPSVFAGDVTKAKTASSAELIFLSIASVLGIGWQIKKRID